MTAKTLTDLWEELKTEAANAWQNVKNEEITLEQKFVPIVEADISTVLSQLKSVAVSTVMSLAGQEFANLTGAQKNVITANTIFQTAKALAQPIEQQDAAMLAQQAYTAVAATVDTLNANAGH